MLLVVTALALGALAPLQDADREVTEARCIFDEVKRIGESGAKPADPFGQAKATCSTRYHWTQGDARRAIEVTVSVVSVFKARREASEAGVDMADIDVLIDAAGERDLVLLGNEATAPEVRNPIIRKIAMGAAAKYGIGEKGTKARGVVFAMAILLYRSRDFTDRHGQPD